jgi:dTMP kinase
MKKAKYICLEGTEGVGKTTQTQLLVDHLRSLGYDVLQTKEPGTPHAPLTMLLRGIMLDNQYDEALTKPAREFISQAIRSVHLERVIIPALSKYDFIIQDRGVLSGYAYGTACGNHTEDLKRLTEMNLTSADPSGFRLNHNSIYDAVVYLKGDVRKNLQKALLAKQEFTTGDAMESRGNDFIQNVSRHMDIMSNGFNSIRIDTNDRSIEEIHSAIILALNI